MSTSNIFYAINPANNEKLEGEFTNATLEQVATVVQKATTAFTIYRKKDKNSIAAFLDQIAYEILNLGDALLERCHLETGLPIARLQGERARTMNQLKLFATVVREGSWVDARIDTAIPDRTPLPKPDIRHMLIPLGTVAVFGASNFPLAFSTAGGDTASALAAGCPVVVKSHEAHPGTSEMVAEAILKAIEICGMPEGTFSLIHGNSRAVGEALVKQPGIKAVGFTGSHSGGKAIFEYANDRPEPIPVFAEMGSTNPVFILPGALEERGEEIATGMAGSITMGTGQFCTSPGLSFVLKSEAATGFYNALNLKISETPAGVMLTPNIKKAYDQGIQKIADLDQVVELSAGLDDDSTNSATPRIFRTSIDIFLKNEALSEENFGPSSIVVEAQTKEAILDAARNLGGHLTATIFGTTKDFFDYRELFDILELKVGRILANGYPTGVEVCYSMVHGGPFPATTAPQATSVGTGAIKRFVRPICFQDFPNQLLPEALKNENNGDLWRLVNGDLTKSKI